MSELQQLVDGIGPHKRFADGKLKSLIGRHACRDGLGCPFGAPKNDQHDEAQRYRQISGALGD